MASLNAMEYGRRFLWAQHLGPSHLVTHTTTRLCAVLLDTTTPVVQQVASAAAARFWHNLQDFMNSCPPGPLLTLGPDHPFICVRDGQLGLNFPQPPVAVHAWFDLV